MRRGRPHVQRLGGVAERSVTRTPCACSMVGLVTRAAFRCYSMLSWLLISAEYRWHVPILTGLAAAAVVYAVFMYALELRLPAGPFQN